MRVDYKLDDVVKASETGALGAGSSSPEIRANKPPVVTIVGEQTLRAKVGEPITLTSTRHRRRHSEEPRGAGAVRGRTRGGAVRNSQRGRRRRRRRSAAAAARELLRAAIRRCCRRRESPSARTSGLHHAYYVYRGAGDVSFSPAQIKVWEDTRAGANSPWAPIWIAPPMPADGKVTAQVTFSEPGTYVVRSQADDGGLLGWDEFIITVTR